MRMEGAGFFVNDTATTEIYTLSLHDALPISGRGRSGAELDHPADDRPGRPNRERRYGGGLGGRGGRRGLKDTRLNFSHANTSYARFFFQKKTQFLHFLLVVTLIDGSQSFSSF